MARDINNPMLWQQAVDEFTTYHLPNFLRPDGTVDTIASCEAWNNWTDSLCKSRQISDWQYKNWSHPPCND
tara:strand:- start:237 stop:449 length:213 start_codon:yes stop_codon:yes gene_type:complete